MTLSTDPYRSNRLFLSPPHMSGKELPLVEEVFRSNWIAPLGPMVDAFEHEFAARIGIGHAAAVASGTAALHLALILLDVSPGDEVICPSFTFCASANPIVYLGAEPVFIDSEPQSWNMDPEIFAHELRRAASRGKLPRAVIVVHLYGQCADMDEIQRVCGEYGIPVVEDAAEALGATYKNISAGTLGRMGVFSFNGNKIITTSGGGMLVSDDPALINKTRFYATQARDDAPHYEHSIIGYNYRMSNLLAAVGRGQLTMLDMKVERKRGIFRLYHELLSEVPGIEFMPEPSWSGSTRWLTCITVRPELFGANREDLRLRLEEYNIESRPLWKPMHLQPVFRYRRMVGGNVCESLFANGLCLPSGTGMTDDDVRFVSGVIAGLHGERRQRSFIGATASTLHAEG